MSIRSDRKAAGLCSTCGKVPPRTGKSNCDGCLAKHKQARDARKASGKCAACGQPALPGLTVCQRCSDYQAEKRAARKSSGLCNRCGKNRRAANTTLCDPCLVRGRDYMRGLRLAALNAYGGPVCKCCGETEVAFLQIDHINNDGADHRRTVGYAGIYGWLKTRNYPPGFQVLCANCNSAKSCYGICPHQLQRRTRVKREAKG